MVTTTTGSWQRMTAVWFAVALFYGLILIEFLLFGQKLAIEFVAFTSVVNLLLLC
jgi:hypothetical protein